MKNHSIYETRIHYQTNTVAVKIVAGLMSVGVFMDMLWYILGQAKVLNDTITAVLLGGGSLLALLGFLVVAILRWRTRPKIRLFKAEDAVFLSFWSPNIEFELEGPFEVQFWWNHATKVYSGGQQQRKLVLNMLLDIPDRGKLGFRHVSNHSKDGPKAWKKKNESIDEAFFVYEFDEVGAFFKAITPYVKRAVQA